MNEFMIEKQNTSKGLIEIVTLRNKISKVVLISTGAGLFSWQYKDQDIIISPKTIEDYLKEDAYYGKTIGRTSGRLVVPSYEIDGKVYKVKPHGSTFTSLHGGETGFSNRNFLMTDISKDKDIVKVTLRYVSKHLEEEYPGKLTLDVTYQLNRDGSLNITHDATTTKDTLCNITNHAYFNFNQSETTIFNHEIKLNASKYLDIDENYLIKGKKDVKDTAFDFQDKKAFGPSINKMKETPFKGFDHTWLFDSLKDDLKASVYNLKANIGLNLYTTYPAVVLYTHNFPATIDLKGNFDKDAFYSSFTLECQFEPGGIHHKDLNQAILRKGETYHHKIKYEPFTK